MRLLFFSQLKEICGAGEAREDLPAGATVRELLEKLYARHPRLRSWDEHILVGVGVEFVGRDHILQEGDEVAIMPPVQGG